MKVNHDRIQKWLEEGATLGPSAKLPEQPVARKRHKYGAKATVVDGITFPSKRQARRYSELLLLQRAGCIWNLRLEVPYDLHAAGGKLVCRYVADFVYLERVGVGGREAVEDCKGMRTQKYVIKRKWMLAEYGITIRET